MTTEDISGDNLRVKIVVSSPTGETAVGQMQTVELFRKHDIRPTACLPSSRESQPLPPSAALAYFPLPGELTSGRPDVIFPAS